MRAMTRRASILPLALALAACDGARVPSQPDGNGGRPAVAEGAAAEPVTPAAAARPAVTLEAEGIRLVDSTSGSARPLAFGAPMEQAVAALAAGFGSAPAERETNNECGAGPLALVRWAGGFTALFQEDRFAGWVAADGLTTADGVGVGSRRAALADHGAQVEQSSLGTEFNAGGLGGLLSSDAADARIIALWAGTTCHFR